MIEIKNVSKKYDLEYALKYVSVTIQEGLNFIVGASGSGKTTLLKIICGMDSDFDGEVLYGKQNIKHLTNAEKSYYYNEVFGFVWQDFNLLEDLSVMENVMLPVTLRGNQSSEDVKNVLKEMKIINLANQKVSRLSGGQKQRVAIARELMKHPQIILADEPTSALDEKTSSEVMDILRKLAKDHTVIIVTHDSSFITDKDHIIELDKGKLVGSNQISLDTHASFKMEKIRTLHLRMKPAISLTFTNIKRHLIRYAITVLTIMIASVLILTAFHGSITTKGEKSFDKLLATYGEGILDMSIVGSFMDASGTDKKNEQRGEVTQDIGGLYEKYASDSRVKFALYAQPFDEITVMIGETSYRIDSSGSVPVFNKLLAGRMPKGKGNEVMVPADFVKKTGLTNDQILGKEMNFESSVYNWDTGNPVAKKVKIKATVVGVSDNTAVTEYEGKTNQYQVNDSFFFSKDAQVNLHQQAGFKEKKLNFIIRAKTPKDLISIKDELNQKGIVPLGQFELIEDMVRLGNQTSQQTGSVNIVIVLLGLVMVIAICTLTNLMRKREYAIYKICGFASNHLLLMGGMEMLSQMIGAIMVMVVTKPIIQVITNSLFQIPFSSSQLLTGMMLIVGLSVIAWVVNFIIMQATNITIALKAGDRS